mmetsp:Transcript_19279/g.39638  ORF Transcript_19279/g.39638 Transcript_19279/m.39638 type:complete len:93 (-) Transcript_19279:214-492(-)
MRFLGEELTARLAKALGLFDATGITALRCLGEVLAEVLVEVLGLRLGIMGGLPSRGPGAHCIVMNKYGCTKGPSGLGVAMLGWQNGHVRYWR